MTFFNKTLLFLVQGSYGRAVADRLARANDRILDADKPIWSAHIPYADVLIPVTVEPAEQLREIVDSIAFIRGIPHVGLELSPTELSCGPLVIPGSTACYQCYRRRKAQHGLTVPDAERLPEGFAPYHVTIGAGLIRNSLRDIDKFAKGNDELGGTVRVFNLVTGVVSQNDTVAVDRCPRCSKRFRESPLTPLSSLSKTNEGSTS